MDTELAALDGGWEPLALALLAECPRCGETLPVGVAACAECGEALAPDEPEVVRPGAARVTLGVLGLGAALALALAAVVGWIVPRG